MIIDNDLGQNRDPLMRCHKHKKDRVGSEQGPDPHGAKCERVPTLKFKKKT